MAGPTPSVAGVTPALLAVEVPPELAAYGAVGAALLLLFRVVFRTMSRTDTETVRQFAQLRTELAHVRRWQAWERARADHYMARAFGDPNPPPIPPPPPEQPDPVMAAPIAPPE